MPNAEYAPGRRVMTPEGLGTVVNPQTEGTGWQQEDGTLLPGVIVRLDSGVMSDVNPSDITPDPRSVPHAYVSSGVRVWRTCRFCGVGANGAIHRSQNDSSGGQEMSTENTDYVVVDQEGVVSGQQCPVLGRFASEQEASEFIATLPDYESGRYGLDGPAQIDSSGSEK